MASALEEDSDRETSKRRRLLPPEEESAKIAIPVESKSTLAVPEEERSMEAKKFNESGVDPTRTHDHDESTTTTTHKKDDALLSSVLDGDDRSDREGKDTNDLRVVNLAGELVVIVPRCCNTDLADEDGKDENETPNKDRHLVTLKRVKQYVTEATGQPLGQKFLIEGVAGFGEIGKDRAEADASLSEGEHEEPATTTTFADDDFVVPDNIDEIQVVFDPRAEQFLAWALSQREICVRRRRQQLLEIRRGMSHSQHGELPEGERVEEENGPDEYTKITADLF
ncbi:unnamed protein product [Amoebophrya sp. A25]|nr:unnamed protein product [Amoebophrya sp. A25]|eukprot:GSA25T00019075001.1